MRSNDGGGGDVCVCVCGGCMCGGVCGCVELFVYMWTYFFLVVFYDIFNRTLGHNKLTDLKEGIAFKDTPNLSWL